MIAPRIVVVGSYAAGLTMKAVRIPGVGETLLGSGYRVDFGGKGSNQAVGCARLGAEVSFVAKIGIDSFGDMALGLYREECIDTAHVKRTSDAPTGVGFIVVEADSGHNCIVLDPGANDFLTSADVAEAEETMIGTTKIGTENIATAVVLTQLEIPVEAAAGALKYGRKIGAITILNPAPVRPLPAFVLELIDVLTPNEKEARVLAGHEPHADVEPEVVAQDLLRLGVKQIVMTLGEKGALIFTESIRKHVPAIQVQAADTTGAGDAFNAGLAVSLAYGDTIEKAVEFAVVTGAMAVTREGVIPSLPRRDDVLEFCKARNVAAPLWLGA